MCGIAGGFFRSPSSFTTGHLDSMLSAIETRGPDDRGIWSDGSLFLGHNRLAIHDLSQAGHQPMLSKHEQSVIIFNGEIYNYLSLRQQIKREGQVFQSECDTEVLLAALMRWGVERTLAAADGMFAFAYWDTKSKKLILARDRIGEKPLYWGQVDGHLVFASELKCFQAVFEDSLTIDDRAVDQFLQFSYIPAPYSIYKNIFKIRPGHYLEFDLNRSHCTPVVVQYWKFQQGQKKHLQNIDVAAELEKTLTEALELQLAADVPVGTFLSGGIDSSLITAMIRQKLGVKASTFSIGFDVPEFDESGHARKIADYLGTNHHEHIFTESDMLDLVPKMAEVYAEPFADSSQIPTYLLCQIAKQEVTVALSGDAGDELFFGYSRYLKTLKRWQKVKRLPGYSRQTLSWMANLAEQYAFKLPIYTSWREALRRGLRYSSSESFLSFYRDTISYDWGVLNAHNSIFDEIDVDFCSPFFLMMYIDLHHYLPDDILVKVDRASMAHSLEVRVPFLSKEVLNLVAHLNKDDLLKRGTGKWILRQLLYKFLPSRLFDRPKQGFGVPMRKWLNSAIRDWAGDLIISSVVDCIPTVDHKKYRRYWAEHQEGRYDWSEQLWNYLVLLSWLEGVRGRRRAVQA